MKRGYQIVMVTNAKSDDNVDGPHFFKNRERNRDEREKRSVIKKLYKSPLSFYQLLNEKRNLAAQYRLD